MVFNTNIITIEKTQSQNDHDLVVVGGGPVGLWTAVLAKINHRELKIVVLEKHDQYQRSHVLQIDPSSFKGIPEHEELSKMVKEFTATHHLRTNIIESKIKEMAQSLGIEIRHQNVDKPQQLPEAFPQAKVFIGADGSHSLVHRDLFESKYSLKEDLHYIAEVKYEVEGKGEVLNPSLEAYPTKKILETVVTEHVGKPGKEEISPITLRLFIDKETYDQCNRVTFKSPGNLDPKDDRLDQTLLKKIWTWLNAKELIKQEKRVEGSERITVTRLGVYASENFVKEDNEGKVWCLVGDAAFGVPFFRSLNNGFLSGTVLAKAVAEYFTGAKNSTIHVEKEQVNRLAGSYFESYESYVNWLSKYEVFVAKIKSFFICFWEWFIKVSNRVPWQVNKWSNAQALQFEPIDTGFKISE